MKNIEELLDFFQVAKNETRQNVTGLIKEAINSSVKVADGFLIIGILEYLQSDKKIKTLTDTAELVEDAVYAAAVEQSSDTLNSILKWSQNNKMRKIVNKGKVFSGIRGLKLIVAPSSMLQSGTIMTT